LWETPATAPRKLTDFTLHDHGEDTAVAAWREGQGSRSGRPVLWVASTFDLQGRCPAYDKACEIMEATQWHGV
jgi:hypothetical protein